MVLYHSQTFSYDKELFTLKCHIPSPKLFGLLVLVKIFIRFFFHIWTRWPSWSCYQDHLYKFSLTSIGTMILESMFGNFDVQMMQLDKGTFGILKITH